MFLEVVHEIVAYCEEHVPDMEVLPVFLSSGYKMEGYISTMKDVDLEKRVNREPVEFGGILHRVLATDAFQSVTRKTNSIVLCSAGREERSGL